MNVELIAEVATNHGGSVELAKEFIRRFADAGADWVKFQHTRVRHLRPDDPQYDWFKQAEFSAEQFAELKAECEKAGTKFLTTVYHAADVPEIVSLGVEAIKIGSGEAGVSALDRAVYKTGLRVLQSVHLVGVRDWSTWVKWISGDVLSCVTRYPASDRACREAISRIGYHGVVGYSDHSIGLEMARWAIESGATIVEKHVQLPNQARDAKAYEATAEEFKALRVFANDDPVAKYSGRWQYA